MIGKITCIWWKYIFVYTVYPVLWRTLADNCSYTEGITGSYLRLEQTKVLLWKYERFSFGPYDGSNPSDEEYVKFTEKSWIFLTIVIVFAEHMMLDSLCSKVTAKLCVFCYSASHTGVLCKHPEVRFRGVYSSQKAWYFAMMLLKIVDISWFYIFNISTT